MRFAALAIAAGLAACSGSRAQEAPPKEPASTTSVTSSALTVSDTTPDVPVAVESDADRALGKKIHRHLAKKPELAKVPWDRVRIVSVDGNVTLTGELPTTADAIEVEHAVREVKGVKGVTNDIHLPRGSE